MVFFLIACHEANKGEDQIGNKVKSNCMSSNGKSHGEIYDISVRKFIVKLHLD